MAKELKLKLSEPITTHAGLIHEITIRAPKGRELMKFKKLPVKFMASGNYDVDYDLAGKYLEAVTGIEISALEDMEAADFDAATAMLTSLATGLSEGNSSTSSTTSSSEPVSTQTSSTT